MARFLALFAGLLLFLGGCATLQQPAPAAPAAAADPFPFHRGVNVLGYDPYWKDSSQARFKWRYFGEIRRAGFDHVRLNLHAFAFMDKDHRLDPAWLAKLDTVVREARAAGLGIIIDEHDFADCAKDVPACRPKISAFWSQIAPRFATAPRNIAFELLNEPHEALDAPTWNALAADLLAIVRKSNPDRVVVIGPTRWNNLAELPNLKLPEGDRNILVTFHYYDPFQFTHQGAGWAGEVKNLSGIKWGSDADKAKIRADFDQVAAWAAANKRPILLGEFGAYDKTGTPVAMRADWTSTVRAEAERHGFGWAAWQFDNDFVAWDTARDTWNEPILRALIPEAR
jgi:endoglucanase